MAQSLKKLKAIELRKSGLSIKEIASIVGVSKGSVSIWCRNIILSKIQQAVLYKKMVTAGHKGRMLGAQANKQKRLDSIKIAENSAAKMVKKFSKRDLLMLGIGLYWGEGSKDSQSRFIFVNSDVDIIKVILLWLNSMDIPKENLSPQIYINEQHLNRIDMVINYWSKELKIPRDKFGNCIFIKSKLKKIYENHDTYMGVLHLNVTKSSFLKYKTMAFLNLVRKNYSHLI